MTNFKEEKIKKNNNGNNMRNVILLEASWEVCNKVGGIYTVISTKTHFIKSNINNLNIQNYIIIGPYFRNKHYYEFTEKEPPEEIKEVFNELKKLKIYCHYGTWEIKDKPNVILIDFYDFFYQKDFIKKKLWEWYKIDSLFSSWDFDEPMLWSWTIGLLAERIIKKTNTKAILHLHEWLSSGAFFYISKSDVNNKVTTIFTTHATMLGRSLASGDNNFYEHLRNKDLDFDKKAYEIRVQEKHLTEKAISQNVDFLTTVSETTGRELETFFGRKPDFILYNGIDLNKFYTFKTLLKKYEENRIKIKEFLTYSFLPYYKLELDNSLILYTMGRSEFKNKGVDVLIESLGKLNEEFKNSKTKKNIFVFFFIPYYNKGQNKILVEKKQIYENIKDKIGDHIKSLEEKTFLSLINKEDINFKDLEKKDPNFLEELRFQISNFRDTRIINPQLSTHLVPEDNEIIRAFRENNLLNREEDRIKVILLPEYLKGLDGFLNLNIYNAVSGCDLGIFPSFYEPWGYTPLESIALSVPSITTNLSGFGNFIVRKNINGRGIFVIKRDGISREEVINNLKEVIQKFTLLKSSKLYLYKIDAYESSMEASWSKLIDNYLQLYKESIKLLNKKSEVKP